MDKKYELTDVCIVFPEVHKSVYRIRSLKDFEDVKVGDMGGFIESEANLSQDGTCWVYDDSIVYDNAIIKDNASVSLQSRVCGNSKILGRAIVEGSDVYGDAVIEDNSHVTRYVNYRPQVYGNSVIAGEVYIEGNVEIGGKSVVSETSSVEDGAVILDTYIHGSAIVAGANLEGSEVFDNAVIDNRYASIFNSKIYGSCIIDNELTNDCDWGQLIIEKSNIYGNAHISGVCQIKESDISGSTVVYGDAEIIDSKLSEDSYGYSHVVNNNKEYIETSDESEDESIRPVY